MPKDQVPRKKIYKKKGGKFVEIPKTAPWEAKGWTREQWIKWHRRWQPETSSEHATLNPSWWASKGTKFRGGDKIITRDLLLSKAHAVHSTSKLT